MLVYCYTRHNLGPIKTPYATPFELPRVTEKEVPANKLYVTSRHYLQYILRSLGDQQDKLVQLTSSERKSLIARKDFPVDFKSRGFESADQLHTFIRKRSKNKSALNFAIMNGIGNGLGDNLVGFGCLQQLERLLAPFPCKFHLLQELNYRTAFLYQYEPNVLLRHSILPVDEFLNMDFIIDMSDGANLPSLDEVPAAVYNAHAFSINKLLPHTELQAELVTSTSKTSVMKAQLVSLFEDDKPMVLLHPKASTALRTMPPAFAGTLIKALIGQGFNVVSAFAHQSPPAGFADVSMLSRNIDDLLHIIKAVDAVVSVGTVVYHMASSLGKPVLLLPTATPDVLSAQLMPRVLAYVPELAADHIQNKHKGDDEESIETAQRYWGALDVHAVAHALKKHIKSSTVSSSESALP